MRSQHRRLARGRGRWRGWFRSASIVAVIALLMPALGFVSAAPATAAVVFPVNTGHDDIPGYYHTIDLQCPPATAGYPRVMYLFIPANSVTLVPPVTWTSNNPALTAAGDPVNPYRGIVSLNGPVPPGTVITVTATDAVGNTGSIALTVVPCHNYPGRGVGDVHLKTFDDVPYDFQQAGEVVLAQTADQAFSVQARLAPVAGKQVTTIQALAANVHGDHVGLYINAGSPWWLVNGSQVSIPPGGYTLPQGGTITPNGTNEWIVTWPSTAGVAAGTTLDAAAFVAPATPRIDLRALTLGPGLAYQGLLGGALGNSDRDPRNDLTPFGGTSPVLPDCSPSTPAYQQPLYATFGNSWLVAGSLPGQPPGQPASLFYQDTPSSWVVADFPQTCTPMPVINLQMAQQDCTNAGVPPFPESQNCMQDVGGTGDTTWTGSYPNTDHDCAVLMGGNITPMNATAGLSNCGDAANTGGAGIWTANFQAGNGTAVMNWSSNKTTEFYISVTSPGQGRCATGATEYDFSGNVAGDTTGSIQIGEAFSANFCTTSPGNLSFVPATVLKF